MIASKKLLSMFAFILCMTTLTGCIPEKNPEVIDIFKSAYNQGGFNAFCEGKKSYEMKLLLGNTDIHLLLKRDGEDWKGTLKLRKYDSPTENGFTYEDIESYNAEIVEENLVIHSEPQKLIPLSHFFCNCFDQEYYRIKQADYAWFQEPNTAEVFGMYDSNKTYEFCDLFYKDFINIFMNFNQKDQYYANIDKLYASNFGGPRNGEYALRFSLVFNEESEISNGRSWGYPDAEMIFAEATWNL